MPNEYPIKHGLPPALGSPKRQLGGRKPLFPFARLKVGEYFEVPSREFFFSKEKELCHAFYKAREAYNRNFQWGVIPGGFAIWREAGDKTGPKKHKSSGNGSAK